MSRPDLRRADLRRAAPRRAAGRAGPGFAGRGLRVATLLALACCGAAATGALAQTSSVASPSSVPSRPAVPAVPAAPAKPAVPAAPATPASPAVPAVPAAPAAVPATPAATPTATPPAAADAASALPGTKPLSAGEARRYLRELGRKLRVVIDDTPMELVTAPDGTMRVRIPADYLFGVDAAQLRTEAPVRLDPLVAVLSKADRTLLEVAGHTDSLGTREFNTAWSLRRAAAVADYLVSKGIAAPRVGMRGAGEMELRERQEDSPAARQRNRRVEIEIRPFRPSRREAS